MRKHITSRIVKSEDLNHHNTLFAGRMSEWFIENSFICAASTYGQGNNIVCLKLKDLEFKSPIHKGALITISSKVVKVSNTSITVRGNVTLHNSEDILVSGEAIFVCVDDKGKKTPHNISL